MLSARSSAFDQENLVFSSNAKSFNGGVQLKKNGLANVGPQKTGPQKTQRKALGEITNTPVRPALSEITNKLNVPKAIQKASSSLSHFSLSTPFPLPLFHSSSTHLILSLYSFVTLLYYTNSLRLLKVTHYQKLSVTQRRKNKKSSRCKM
jgi:hypothetical protein